MNDAIRDAARNSAELMVARMYESLVDEIAKYLEAFLLRELKKRPEIAIEDLGPVHVDDMLRFATLREQEMVHIRRVLASTGGNKMAAARILGINVKTLYNKVKVNGNAP